MNFDLRPLCSHTQRVAGTFLRWMVALRENPPCRHQTHAPRSPGGRGGSVFHSPTLKASVPPRISPDCVGEPSVTRPEGQHCQSFNKFSPVLNTYLEENTCYSITGKTKNVISDPWIDNKTSSVMQKHF